MMSIQLDLTVRDNSCDTIQITNSEMYHGLTYYNRIYKHDGFSNGRPSWNWEHMVTGYLGQLINYVSLIITTDSNKN